MSGPKVVRVVTREELQAEGLASMRAIDAAIARCERLARSLELWTDQREQAFAARRKELARLFDRDQWVELRRASSADLTFLQDEHARIAGVAVEKAERALKRRRRLGDAARSIVTQLEADGRIVPSALHTIGRRSNQATDSELAEIESELNVAILSLGTGKIGAKVSEEQRSLASRLAVGEESQTVVEWVARHATATWKPDPVLDRRVAELVVLAPELAGEFVQRMELIAQESSADRRALLSDSLALDVQAQIAKQKVWSSLRSRLEEGLSLLDGFPDEDSSSLRKQVVIVLAKRDETEVGALIDSVQSRVDKLVTTRTASARRKAVLQGLAALGYEVREHMETALAQQGRVVLRKAGMTDYGLELGTHPGADRMQLRVVGAAVPTEPRTAGRDRDAEVQWCTQIDQLKSELAQIGTEFVIDQAVLAGQLPVKSVEFSGSHASDAQTVDLPQLRVRKL